MSDIGTQLRSCLQMDISDDLVVAVERFAHDPNLRMILLTGSGAMGKLRPLSDIDLVFLMAQPGFSHPSYELKYFNERLVSFSVTTYREWEDHLKQLQHVRYLRDAILSAKLIHETEEGMFQQLWNRVNRLDPESFLVERRERINKLITGYVEELHKLCNGVIDDDSYLIYYGLLGLQLGVWQVLLNHYDLYMKSENDTIPAVLEALDRDQRREMVSLWREMWGIEGGSDMTKRGRAGIKFYLELINLVNLHLTETSRMFLEQTKMVIATFVSDLG